MAINIKMMATFTNTIMLLTAAEPLVPRISNSDSISRINIAGILMMPGLRLAGRSQTASETIDRYRNIEDG
jgi:hypothetical protein